MVLSVRSAEYAPGKREEQLEFLKKVVSYDKKNGVETRILRRASPSAGQAARVLTERRFLEENAARRQSL